MTSSEQADSLGGPGGQSFMDGMRNEAAKRGPLYAGAAALMVLAVLGAVIWTSYPRHGAPANPDAVPLIRADAAPYRTRPDDPGGMNIPYRDSTVFNALHGDDGASADKVENLMPQPEQPLSREKLIPGFKADAAPATAAAPAAAAPAVTKLAPAPVTAPAVAPPVAKPVQAAPVVAATAPAVAPAKTAAPVSTSGYFVQLGSVRAEGEAAGAWKKLQGSFTSLAGLKLHVDKADLGAKGIHYRLRGGPLSQQKAKDICAAVTAAGKPGGCFVVRH
jgi:hypothetical protein